MPCHDAIKLINLFYCRLNILRKEHKFLNKSGMFSWFGYVLPLEKRLDLIKKAEFSATSVMYSGDEDYFVTGEEDRIPELVREKGLYFDNIHAPFIDYNNLWSETKEKREEIRQVLEGCIDYCRRHKIPAVVMHVTKGKNPPEPDERGLEVMKGLVKYAEDARVTIALENTRKEKHLDFIFSNINSPCLGLCYDSGHDFLHSPEPGRILKKWGHLLKITHFSDNNGLEDDHWIPGKGVINWDIIKVNFPKDYEGVISLESFPAENDKPEAEIFLKQSFEAVKILRYLLF